MPETGSGSFGEITEYCMIFDSVVHWQWGGVRFSQIQAMIMVWKTKHPACGKMKTICNAAVPLNSCENM